MYRGVSSSRPSVVERHTSTIRIAANFSNAARGVIRRHHQGDHHLPAIRPTISAVAVLGLGNLLAQPLEVGAGQIVQQHIELGVEQRLPALRQVPAQLVFVGQEPAVFRQD